MKIDRRSVEAQEELFNILRRIKTEFPDLRTGQIIYNGLSKNSLIIDNRLFNIEDDRLTRDLTEWFEEELIKKLAGI